MRCFCLAVVVVLLATSTAGAAPLAGFVLDGKTMQPVRHATIAVQGSAVTTMTNEQGGFSLDVAAGQVTLDITADNYDVAEQDIPVPSEGTLDATILVFPKGSLGEQVEVFDRPPLVKTTPGQTELTRDELTTVPGARADPLTALRNLPGVANVDPFTPGQYVFGVVLRGMAAEDSMYFVNGIELPLLYHFFGVQSILPAEMIDSIEFVPGGFDVQYGRATGGIINIHVRPSRTDHWTGFAELSFINAGGFVEGPISKEHHLRLTAAARRSVVDALLPLALSDSDHVSFTTNPQYYDGQLRLDWSPNEHDDLSLLGFTSWDFAAAGIGQVNALDPNASGSFSNRVGFTRIAPSYHHHDRDLELFARAWTGDAHYKYAEGAGLFQDGRGWISGGRADLGYRIIPALKLRTGGEFQIYHLTADARFPLPPAEGQPGTMNSTTEPSVTLRDHALQQDTAAAYIAADLSLGSRLSITPGLRFDRYITINRQSWSPRVTASAKLSSDWTARASVGEFTRPPNGLEALVTTLAPERAIHYVAGAELAVADGITFTTNAFYNDITDLVTYDATRAVQSPLDGYVNRATGHTFGLEAMLRVQHDDWFGWMTYTLSHSVRRDAPGAPLRLFDYDQPNNLIIVLSRRWNRWRFGGRFQITTGEPTTPVTGATYNSDLDVYIPQYGPVDSTRKEAAHQLDLRVDREWQMETWKLSAFVDLSNVYDHERTTGFNYDFNYGQRTPITTFPIFPALGIRGTF